MLSNFKVNKNNVKMLKIFWGPKMHFQNIVDGKYFKKIYFLNFYGNKIGFLIFETIHILNPFLTIPCGQSL
jgi:hypothetical protein